MERKNKGLIFFAVFCIIVGCVLSVVAAFAGGIPKTREMVDNGGLVLFSSNVIEEENMAEEHTIPLSRLTMPSLQVELAAGNFEIKESNRKDIFVKASQKVGVTLDGETLKIITKNTGTFFNISFGENINNITIEIPQGLHFDKVTAMVGAGNLSCGNLSSNSLKLKVAAGELVMNACDSKELKAEVSMGNFIFRGKMNGDTEVDCGMGNAQMWLDGVEKDYNYDIDCAMGNVIIGDDTYGGISTKKDIDNKAFYNIEVDCGMGNVEVYFNN